MPESKGRKKPVYTPPPAPQKVKKNRPWVVPAMLTAFVLGILWLVLFYLFDFGWQDSLGGQAGNLGIGFGLMVVGFILATKWE